MNNQRTEELFVIFFLTDGEVPEVLEDVLLELLLSHLHGERGLAHRAHLPRHAETPFTRVQGEFGIKCDTVNEVATAFMKSVDAQLRLSVRCCSIVASI